MRLPPTCDKRITTWLPAKSRATSSTFHESSSPSNARQHWLSSFISQKYKIPSKSCTSHLNPRRTRETRWLPQSKNDGPPGNNVLWRGLSRLTDICLGLE